jgi:hypothetical protein
MNRITNCDHEILEIIDNVVDEIVNYNYRKEAIIK